MIQSLVFAFSLICSNAFVNNKPLTSFIFRGDTPPLNYFDPLQITKTASDDTLKYLREAELQHSRIAMVSSILFPILEVSHDTPAVNYLSNAPDSTQYAWLALFSIYELARMNAGWQNPFNKGKPFSLENNYEPGAVFITKDSDFFNSPSCFRQLDCELNNGRLAMLGLTVTMINELVSNQPLFN